MPASTRSAMHPQKVARDHRAPIVQFQHLLDRQAAHVGTPSLATVPHQLLALGASGAASRTGPAAHHSGNSSAKAASLTRRAPPSISPLQDHPLHARRAPLGQADAAAAPPPRKGIPDVLPHLHDHVSRPLDCRCQQYSVECRMIERYPSSCHLRLSSGAPDPQRRQQTQGKTLITRQKKRAIRPMTDTPLSGKTAFVSGSGQNIGRAIAAAACATGMQVVVNGARPMRAPATRPRHFGATAGAQTLVAMGDVGRAQRTWPPWPKAARTPLRRGPTSSLHNWRAPPPQALPRDDR